MRIWGRAEKGLTGSFGPAPVYSQAREFYSDFTEKTTMGKTSVRGHLLFQDHMGVDWRSLVPGGLFCLLLRKAEHSVVSLDPGSGGAGLEQPLWQLSLVLTCLVAGVPFGSASGFAFASVSYGAVEDGVSLD
ncbi:hypothetical protein CB1_001451041 [Camelus ferus]|nr:hypothetical protein CB1_001451041 [Camelus ferus]